MLSITKELCFWGIWKVLVMGMVVGRFLWSPCSVPWFSSLVFWTLSGEGITCSLQRWEWRGHAVSISVSFAHSAGWNLVPVRPEGTCTESLGKIQLTTSLASLKKQKQKTRTSLCKECHHLCSHLVLFEKFGRDTFSCSPHRLSGPQVTPATCGSYCTRIFTPPAPSCSELQAKDLESKKH